MSRSVFAIPVLVLACAIPAQAAADPKDETQLRTMVCDNGQTVEAIIHFSNTSALHVTTSTNNFVIKRLSRDGVVFYARPGFDDVALVTCETVEFNLTVVGFFTPREPLS
jgi:hypothetical protein